MLKMIRFSAVAISMACLTVIAGCATQVGVNKVSPQEAYKVSYANPLSQGVLSDQAKFVLNRANLLQKFDKEPAAAIAELHQKALHDNRSDILYALAEVCYLYGSQLVDSYDSARQTKAPDYFLLSTLYSFYFVSGEYSRQSLNIFDHRIRAAVDMFNYGLWQGLATGENGTLVFESKLRKLPFGQITITLDTAQFPWKMAEFESFEPADRYAVRGVSVRNRTAGIGVPLIAIKKTTGNEFSSGQAVPVTAALRIQGGLADLAAGTATASLEMYSTQDDSTVKDLMNNDIPLESDLTTPLAYKLEGSEFFDLGLSGFLGREPNKIPDGLYLQEPYLPGKIPVVFVHGTASNPVWWVEMFNTLRFDPLIRQNYQFWYFVYTSNKAVALSAAELREALSKKVAELDPQGKDAALQQMVVVGHSQGGLLTKFTAVDSGEKLVETVTGKSLAELDMSAENRARIARLLVIKPLPFVKTVIFMSTPHRGSFQSKAWNRNLVRSLIKLPAKLVQTSIDMFDYMTDDVKRVLGGKAILTSADSMSPDNPVMNTLADIPLAPGVKGHSIIAVQGDGDPKLGNDGVVEYKSAHLEGMASELIVKSGHSSQLNPLAIDEVRRILVEKLGKK
jgi:pimeloyl-ACP methyl ester carboxylesterase